MTRSYDQLRQLWLLQGVCAVGLDPGQLALAAGVTEQGLAVLQRTLDGFRELRQEERASAASSELIYVQHDRSERSQTYRGLPSIRERIEVQFGIVPSRSSTSPLQISRARPSARYRNPD